MDGRLQKTVRDPGHKAILPGNCAFRQLCLRESCPQGNKEGTKKDNKEGMEEGRKGPQLLCSRLNTKPQGEAQRQSYEGQSVISTQLQLREQPASDLLNPQPQWIPLHQKSVLPMGSN